MKRTSKQAFVALASAAAMVSASVAVDATGRASVPVATPETYDVTIARDSFGVPHITAADWGSLGFGQGYAFAEDRACTLLDQIVKVRGERARWFGPGEDDANVNSDFAYRHLGIWEDAPQRWADQPEPSRRSSTATSPASTLRSTSSAVNGWCAGEPWVAPITTQDLYAYLADVLLLASSRNLINEIGAAQPPTANATDGRRVRPRHTAGRLRSACRRSPRATPGPSAPRRPLPAAGCCSPTRTSRGRASCASGRAT